jgi:hypothetical protein
MGTAHVWVAPATLSCTMRSTPREQARQRAHRPLESESLTIAQSQPSGVHHVEFRREWSGLAAFPREVVAIHDPLDRDQRRVVRAHDRSALRRWPASRYARKPPAMRQKSPEPVSDFEHALDRELRQIVRQIASRCHRRALKWPAVRRRGDPAADATLVAPIEFDEHDHRFPHDSVL